MAKFAGNDLVLHVASSAGSTSYGLVGGASSHTYTLTNTNVDTTDKDSSRWGSNEAFGRRQIAFSFNGFVSDNANFAKIETIAETDADNLSYKILYGDSKVVTCDFHVDSFEATGEAEGAQTFSISMTSSGTPTFA